MGAVGRDVSNQEVVSLPSLPLSRATFGPAAMPVLTPAACSTTTCSTLLRSPPAPPRPARSPRRRPTPPERPRASVCPLSNRKSRSPLRLTVARLPRITRTAASPLDSSPARPNPTPRPSSCPKNFSPSSGAHSPTKTATRGGTRRSRSSWDKSRRAPRRRRVSTSERSEPSSKVSYSFLALQESFS